LIGSILSPRKILDFDTETRKIGFHIGGQWKPDGCEPIAISWSFIEGPVVVRQLGANSPEEMLTAFLEAYNEADIVTGHNIRNFDLPILNGALIERGLPMLSPKLTQDTLKDLVRRAGWSSSQENLGAMFELLADKYHMNDTKWREGTRLTPEGVELTRRRVMDDVVQHMQLRVKLLERGMLRRPRVWHP
jgi:DNA polymerase elongation subunit (family B)